MNNQAKLLLIIFLTLAWALTISGPASAMTIWTEGRVTKAPWTDNEYRHLEVNGVKFTLMPKANIWKRTKNYKNIYNEKPIALNRVRPGQKVLIRHQGHRIYELVVLR
ncbi:MAG: hypothetical protein SV487_10360 [Thermodesulfobacteriota bacterium]|nr:hypothetical protein [Thermodesulfobacteriota bacterium]